jgi:hypothetical protein
MTDFIKEEIRKEEGFIYPEIELVEINPEHPKDLHDLVKARHIKDYGYEPCDAEVQDDIAFLNRCKSKMKNIDKKGVLLYI